MSPALWVCLILAAYFLIYLYLIFRNRKHNCPLDQNPIYSTRNRILNDQNRKTGQTFRYGLNRAGWNGCEAIAIHNAKVILGVDSTLSGTMTAIQTSGGMLCYGFFGSNPFVIGRVLKKSGIRAHRIKKYQLSQPGLYILSFWNEGAPWNGAHTVACRCDGKLWTLYNYHGNGRESTIPPLTFGRRFICAYRLEEPQCAPSTSRI